VRAWLPRVTGGVRLLRMDRLAALPGRLTRRLLAAALIPVVAGCDVALAALAVYQARREAPALIAALEADLADAAR
jgi:hypothetical protein